VPDSIADSSIMEFQNIGVLQMEWDKFNMLSSYAKAFTKSTGNGLEKPQPFMDLFILLWPGDWKKQLQQLNEAIERDYKKYPSTNILSAKLRQFQQTNILTFLESFSFLGPWVKGANHCLKKILIDSKMAFIGYLQ